MSATVMRKRVPAARGVRRINHMPAWIAYSLMIVTSTMALLDLYLLSTVVPR
jgi:hypothetical protein